jgi:hypothetical protein
MSKETMKDIINYYNIEVKKLGNLYKKKGQGAVRGKIGQLFQDVAKKLIILVDPSLTCKHNDYLTKTSPTGKFKVTNLQVDLHIYRDEKLLFILESKTYLDVSYLKRALEDFREIREITGDVPAIVWSGQDAVSKNAFGYYNEIYNFETFFCNVTKKRNPKNPIYKTCDPLDEKELRRFCNYVKEII